MTWLCIECGLLFRTPGPHKCRLALRPRAWLPMSKCFKGPPPPMWERWDRHPGGIVPPPRFWTHVSRAAGAIAAAFLLSFLVGCGQDRFDFDKHRCQQDSPENVHACLRAKGWHDASGLRNSE